MLMPKEQVELALGRKEDPIALTEIGSPILVTGSLGSIGEALVEQLRGRGYLVWAKDVEDMDVRDVYRVNTTMHTLKPNVVFHLAGAKHAPYGEEDPYGVVETNTIGTHNVLALAPKDAVVVVASTCKAANPETAYGASKLIAERMALNAGQRVARFYNVVESADNVFERWAALPADDPIPVTSCSRYFISLEESLSLLNAVATLPCGRYTVDPGLPRNMVDVARALYPERRLKKIERRRGDRTAEPLTAAHEMMYSLDNLNGRLCEIVSPHDTREDA